MQSIHIVQDSLPFAWESAVMACWNQGDSFPTQYDKPDDPNSRDVVATIHVRRPFDEPRIHRCIPGGFVDLEKYRAEVLFGVHDYWMFDQTNPNRWEYTYHERLFEYRVPGSDAVIDQIARCVQMLKECSYTRRAQAVTWQAWMDLSVSDPPCLQRMWFRVQNKKLNLAVHMRSNDAYKAAFFNMYAFTELQKLVAEQIGVEPGEYVHIADSFHVYGSYFKEFEGFLKLVAERPPADRVYTTEFGRDFFIEACDELLAETGMPEKCREMVRQRKAQLTAS